MKISIFYLELLKKIMGKKKMKKENDVRGKLEKKKN